MRSLSTATVNAVLTVSSSPDDEGIHGVAESRAERAGEGAGGLAVVELKQFCVGQGNGSGVPIQKELGVRCQVSGVGGGKT
jgi:hypothetical protein